MRTYSIDYTEVYSKNYEVEANTFEEAKNFYDMENEKDFPILQ